ncbi:MAG: hypothetical protein SF029_16610 [bacterium]|nr:hypothetical protein [bacterium]
MKPFDKDPKNSQPRPQPRPQPRHVMREKLLFRYTAALERGDWDTVEAVLREAETDPILDRMIVEVDEALQAEMSSASRPESLPDNVRPFPGAASSGLSVGALATAELVPARKPAMRRLLWAAVLIVVVAFVGALVASRLGQGEGEFASEILRQPETLVPETRTPATFTLTAPTITETPKPSSTPTPTERASTLVAAATQPSQPATLLPPVTEPPTETPAARRTLVAGAIVLPTEANGANAPCRLLLSAALRLETFAVPNSPATLTLNLTAAQQIEVEGYHREGSAIWYVVRVETTPAVEGWVRAGQLPAVEGCVNLPVVVPVMPTATPAEPTPTPANPVPPTITRPSATPAAPVATATRRAPPTAPPLVQTVESLPTLLPTVEILPGLTLEVPPINLPEIPSIQVTVEVPLLPPLWP